jgi:hypothetical protein
MASLSPSILPKDKRFLSLLKARPGYVLIHSDISSLEPTVLAELSRDPLLMEVYNSGRAHDIYLFMAIKSGDRQAAAINAAYNVDNPTAESVAAAKKQFKDVRNAWKLITLMSAYGSGAEKKRKSAQTQDIWMTKEDAKFMHDAYQAALEGTSRFKEQLAGEWQANGGWIHNALGRPVGCPADKQKDLTSRCVQAGGHDITIKWIAIIDRLRKERAIPMYPWNVDIHDATIWEVREDYRDQGVELFKDSITILNQELGGTIPIKADPDVGQSFKDFKE